MVMLYRNNFTKLYLLLLFAAHFLSGKNEDCLRIVSQSPRNLTLSDGETAEIKCSWKDLNNVRVNWLKNTTELKNLSRQNIIPEENSSTLVIYNVCSDDSGSYVCKVNQEIPILRQCKGAGTQLTVNSKTKCKSQNLYYSCIWSDGGIGGRGVCGLQVRAPLCLTLLKCP